MYMMVRIDICRAIIKYCVGRESLAVKELLDNAAAPAPAQGGRALGTG